jgi:fructokinase
MNVPVLERSIVVLGEVLVDLFVKQDKPRAGVSFTCTGLPGGAPGNVAVHLARRGLPVQLVTAFGDDGFGEALQQFLRDRGVGLDFAVCGEMSSTPLAAVYQNAAGYTEFRIYMEGTALSHLTPEAVAAACEHCMGWFHFGSVLMSLGNARALTTWFVQKAADNGAVVTYDINIRPNIIAVGSEAARDVVGILSHVDILKISDDDFAWIKHGMLPGLQSPRDFLNYGCKLVAWTHGPNGATLLTKDASCFVAPPQVEPVDTTGAGDGFTAGLIQYFWERKVSTKEQLSSALDEGSSLLTEAGEYAAAIAGDVISRVGALPGGR